MSPRMKVFRFLCAVIALAAAQTIGAQSAGRSAIVPLLDAHQHLRSPDAAANQSDNPPPKISLPPELDTFLQARIKAEQDKAALAQLYVEHAWLLQSFDPAWIQTRDSIVDW